MTKIRCDPHQRYILGKVASSEHGGFTARTNFTVAYGCRSDSVQSRVCVPVNPFVFDFFHRCYKYRVPFGFCKSTTKADGRVHLSLFFFCGAIQHFFDMSTQRNPSSLLLFLSTMRVLRRLLGKSGAAQQALVKPTKVVQDDTQSNQSQADVDLQYQIDLALSPEALNQDSQDGTVELTQASTTTDEERRRERRERKASKRSQSRDGKPLKETKKKNAVVKKDAVKKNAVSRKAASPKKATATTPKKTTRKQMQAKAEQEEQKLAVKTTNTPKEEHQEVDAEPVDDKQEDLEDDHHLELLPAVQPPEFIYVTIEQDENDDAWRCQV